MRNMQQRLAGGLVLTIVSAVSIMAGGVLLSGASAEDGSPASGANTATGTPSDAKFVAATLLSNPEDGLIGCVFASSGDIPAPELSESGGMIGMPGTAISAGSMSFTYAFEARPISPEEIERLKASGELKTVSPEDCVGIDIDGEMPEGFELKRVP